MLVSCLTNCEVVDRGFIKSLGSEYEVTQVVGGTRQTTNYVYVYADGCFVNIKRLQGSRFVSRTRRRRNMTEEVYRVPRDVLDGKVILNLSFSTSGHFSAETYTTDGGAVKRYSCDLLRDEESALKIASMFCPVGDEWGIAKLYLDLVPKLSREAIDIVRRSGAEIHTGSAERLSDALRSPGFSILICMALTTPQGRVQCLLNNMSHVLELFTAANVVEALDGVSLSGWFIWFTGNVPLTTVKSRITGREYTIFYQPSILPHTLSIMVPDARGLPKHLVPDIVIFEGRIDYVGWGKLMDLVNQGKTLNLLIEVKLGIRHIRWEEPQYVIEQMSEYIKLLRPRNIALVSLSSIDPELRKRLEELGVAVFENITSETIQNSLKNYIIKALSTQ